MKRYPVFAIILIFFLLLCAVSVSAEDTEPLILETPEEYQAYLETTGLPKGCLTASSLAILGDLRSAAIGEECCYNLVDINGYAFSITMEPRGEVLYAYGRDEIRSISQNIYSMYDLEIDPQDDSFVYARNGVYYTYTSGGKLYCIEWLSNGTVFRIDNFRSSYPMSGKNTILKGLLSRSDSEANAAIEELAVYAGIDIDPKAEFPVTFWPVVGFLTLAAAASLIFYWRNKRLERAESAPDYSRN